MHTAPVHVRGHFLLNTGDGTAALKWGSTNAYTEDAAGNPIYSWTLIDGIMDTITSAGALPLVEIGIMPQALSDAPDPYRNSGSMMLDGGCFYPPEGLREVGDLIPGVGHARDERYPNAGRAGNGSSGTSPTSDTGTARSPNTPGSTTTPRPRCTRCQTRRWAGPLSPAQGALSCRSFSGTARPGTNAVTVSTGTRLDLVSFHAKGGAPFIGDHVEMSLGNQMRLHRAGFNAVAARLAIQTDAHRYHRSRWRRRGKDRAARRYGALLPLKPCPPRLNWKSRSEKSMPMQ